MMKSDREYPRRSRHDEEMRNGVWGGCADVMWAFPLPRRFSRNFCVTSATLFASFSLALSLSLSLSSFTPWLRFSLSFFFLFLLIFPSWKIFDSLLLPFLLFLTILTI